MTSHVPIRHPVAFGSRAPRKSESVYYNLLFWLFLRHLWTFSGVVIFSPKTFLGKPTWLIICCVGTLHHLRCVEKLVHTTFIHLSWNPKLPQNERKCIHIFVPIHLTHFQWLPMSLGGITWRSELEPWESPKTCILTFNFGCFWDIIGLLRASSYFLPKHS